MTAEAFDWLVNGSDDIYRTEADSLISVIGTLECCHPCVIWQKEKKNLKEFLLTLTFLFGEDAITGQSLLNENYSHFIRQLNKYTGILSWERLEVLHQNHSGKFLLVEHRKQIKTVANTEGAYKEQTTVTVHAQPPMSVKRSTGNSF